MAFMCRCFHRGEKKRNIDQVEQNWADYTL